jgi:hypothetical protein
MGDMVEFVNRVSRRISRPVQLVHMPVPRAAPTKPISSSSNGSSCGRKPSCASASSITPTASRVRKSVLAAAGKYVSRFSIATECGSGRRDPSTIPELLRIHAAVAQLD